MDLHHRIFLKELGWPPEPVLGITKEDKKKKQFGIIFFPKAFMLILLVNSLKAAFLPLEGG